MNTQGTDGGALPSDDSGTTTPSDATYYPPNDSGIANPPPTTFLDPFQGAPAYKAPSNNGGAHNPGQACIACHVKKGEKSLLIGGTVYADYAGTTPLGGVEIRVLDTQGHAMSTYSGSNGNFYISKTSTITTPFVVGARNATSTRPMITQLDGTKATGDCNMAGCHVGIANGGYYVVHVP